MESEFPSNSQRRRDRNERSPEPKRVERVTSGEVVRRKKPLGKRMREIFIGGGEFVASDVLVPAAKDMFLDAIREFAERMIFPEGTHSRSRSRARRGDYTPYHRYSNDRRRDRDEPRSMSRRARSNHDFDEIILDSRAEAEEVIDQLFEIINKYEVATVADLYHMVGITGDYTDEKYGWSDLRGAKADRIKNGYLLDLPRPEPLD